MNVRVSCQKCGDITIESNDLKVRICAQSKYKTYTFGCPKCGDRNVYPASDEVTALLRAGGIALEIWDLPAEIYEAHTGPPFCGDDILDWHIELNGGTFSEQIWRNTAVPQATQPKHPHPPQNRTTNGLDGGATKTR
jgi:predicted nucleic-acid-binding Zn-ribbon protein